jgi:hypothetical protein
MRTWLRDHGLLIANLLLFVIFFGGMVLSGVRVYNAEQLEHAEQAVSLGRYLRELGERIPANGDVRRADRLPLPARILRVEAR